jgi:hypothetical protein
MKQIKSLKKEYLIYSADIAYKSLQTYFSYSFVV